MKIKSLSRPRLLLPALSVLMVAGGWAFTRAPAQADDATYLALKADGHLSTADLKTAIDPLFDDGTGIGETRAVLILRDGKVIAERYGPGFGPESRMLSWSIAKTVTGLLVGIMVGDGRLALDDPAPVPAWRQPGDPRAAITLRQLLQMRAGLQHVETTGPLEKTDALRMLVGPGAQDQLGYAEARPLAATPGSRFTYSSGNSTILGGLVTARLTDSTDPQVRRDAMMQFIDARLAGPLGMTGLVPEFDARGTLLGGAMMHMTARDYAKIGELLRLRGRVGDRQLLPQGWIDFMTQSSPTNPAYGGQLWTNRHGKQDELFPGEAPDNVFGAVGYRGQYVIVSPTQHLTIVRLGVTREEDRPALRHRLAELVRVFEG